MKQQVKKRLGAAHVRDTLEQFVSGEITRFEAMESLQIGKSRLYELKKQYLAARAEGKVDDWMPPSSGGNHMPAWPDKAQKFLKDVLSPGGDAKRREILRNNAQLVSDGDSRRPVCFGLNP